MDERFIRFVDMWNAGVKASKIMDELNCDENEINYLKRQTKVAPRRKNEILKKKGDEIWELVLKRIPIEEIAKEKNESVDYVKHLIWNRGYKISDFYDTTRRRRKKVVEQPKNGVRCTPSIMARCKYGTTNCCMYIDIEGHRRPCPSSDCTCFKQRPKNFKQKSYEGRTE